MDPILLKAAISAVERCHITEEIDNQISVQINSQFVPSNQIDFWEKIAPLCNHDRANVSVILTADLETARAMNGSSKNPRFIVVPERYVTFTNVYLQSSLVVISEKKYISALVAFPTDDNFEKLLESLKKYNIEVEHVDTPVFFEKIDFEAIPIKLLIPIAQIKIVTFLDC